MKQKEGKPHQSDKSSWKVPIALTVVVLCGLSFYLGGIFCSEKERYVAEDISKVVNTPTGTANGPVKIKAVSFPECSAEYQDYTPCTDPKRWHKYGRHRLAFLERHCPPSFERQECLVPPPDGYKSPIRWPKSKNECWYRNVPYDWINKQKSNQHWLKKEGKKFLFPGGGTMFPNGVGAYVDLMQDLIPQMKDGTIRTAIDTGCGVASWGGDLLDRGILTVSLAPRDNHQAQVQFALERGIPAILGIISTQRLPFPSNSFDMAHCSRCLIPWTEFGGVYLLEIHRILRPGGFWVLSGPPVNYQRRWRGWNTTIEEQKSDYDKLQELLTSMCFKLFNKKDDIAVWQKLSDNSCYKKLDSPDNYPSKCDDGTEPDSAWYTPLRPCVVVPNPAAKKLKLDALPKWPERLHVAPERVSDVRGGSAGAFKHDDDKWKARAKHYKKLLPAIGTDKIRNVMDMNTLYGGFAAAVVDDPLWFMNVVSSYRRRKMGRRILNDALRTIVNAEKRGFASAELQPVSNVIANFLQIMKYRGYIKDFQVHDPHRVGKISVQLLGRINDCRALTYRQDIKATTIENYKTRALPTRQWGYVVITTPNGVLDHEEAQRQNVGGQVIGYFY